MAASLVTIFNALMRATLTDGDNSFGLGNPQGLAGSLQNGTGINQADLEYSANFSVASGTPLVLNLTDGSLKMANGASAVFVRVKGLYIVHKGDPSADATKILSVGGGTQPLAALTNEQDVGGPGAFRVQWIPTAAGLAVAVGSADRIQLKSSSGTIPGYLLLVGGSA